MATGYSPTAPGTPTGGKNPHKERTPEWWCEEIRKGLLYQEMFGRPSEWRRFRAYYRHQWPTGSTMPLNLVFSTIRSMIPQVYFRNPKVFVTATKPGMEMHARTVEAIDNNLIKELGLKEQMKKVIRDAAVQGSGVLWRGYDSEFGWDPEQVDPLSSDSTLTHIDKKGYRIEYNSYVNPGMPWALRDDLEATILPWGTRDPRTSEWTARRVIRKLSDVQSDVKYKNTKDLQAVKIVEPTTAEYSRLFDSDEYCEFFEIRDVKTSQIYCVVMDYCEFIREDVDEMQIDGLPLHWLVFNEDPVFPWGIPDVRIMEPQQLEINETRKLSMYHRRVALVKMLYKKGALKKEEVEKLLDEDVKAAIGVDSDGPISDAVAFVQSQMPQDLNVWAEIVRQDIREITGFGRNQMGVNESSRTTATEAKISFGSSEIRLDERRDMAADFMEGIIHGINKTIFKFWNTRRVVQVVGPSGLPGWIQYTGEMLKDDYTLRIDPNNGTAISGETRKADGMQILQLWGAVAKGAPPPPELTKFIFSNYEGINTEALIAQINALYGQNTAALPGGSPENPATIEQAQSGKNVSPAFASAGAPGSAPSAPQQGGY